MGLTFLKNKLIFSGSISLLIFDNYNSKDSFTYMEHIWVHCCMIYTFSIIVIGFYVLTDFANWNILYRCSYKWLCFISYILLLLLCYRIQRRIKSSLNHFLLCVPIEFLMNVALYIITSMNYYSMVEWNMQDCLSANA